MLFFDMSRAPMDMSCFWGSGDEIQAASLSSVQQKGFKNMDVTAWNWRICAFDQSCKVLFLLNDTYTRKPDLYVDSYLRRCTREANQLEQKP